MLGRYAATVCCIVHDEMYFPPAFLAYYRGLGVDRFVVLDDRSTDGTAEYLAAQPDVMVVESAVRYFEEVDYAPAAKAKVREPAPCGSGATSSWTSSAPASGRSTSIPTSSSPSRATISRPYPRPRGRGGRGGLGVMVDMYPARISDILGGGLHDHAPIMTHRRPPGRFSLEDGWYFDGRPPLDPGQAREDPPSRAPSTRAASPASSPNGRSSPRDAADAAQAAARATATSRTRSSTRRRSSAGRRATGSSTATSPRSRRASPGWCR